MRSVKYILAAGAASLLSHAALAADMPMAPPAYYPPPPVEDPSGWYLRGDIGFSNQQVKNIRHSDPANYANLTSLNQTAQFDTAGIFGVGVGYQFNNWFRGDVTAQYRGNSNFKGTDRINGLVAGNFTANGATQAYSGTDSYSASKSEVLVLANAYVDLGTWWCVTPFVGAGVGAARVTISNFTDNGINNLQQNAAGLFSVGGPPVASSANASSASKWNFAWAAHTGLAYKVSPNVTMELAYSYVNLGSGTTASDLTTFDGTGRGNSYKFNDITSHDVKLGVRWNLDPAPTYLPPPPLVRKG
jgi:opacity protein-like surface antigen